MFTNVWFQGAINSSTGIMETSSIFVCSDFIPITPLITYSCSRTVSREYNNLRCYDANKQYVGTGSTNANVGNPLNNGASFGTFMITNESVAYIRFNDKSNDLTTKYMLVEGKYTASTMPDYEPYGYKVPVVVSSNNLAKWDTHLQPQTNGIVLNDINSISSIIDVTNINNIYIFGDRTKLNSNVYRIGKSNEPISLNSQTTRITYVGGVLDTSDCNYVIVSCSIYNTETTFDDIKNSFMIVEGTTSPDNFEPYHDPTTTNIYLDEPIEENESISLSDTNVNIPTIKGTNILSVDTTVQPSKVYVKARKESSYETAMREDYEEQLSDIESALQEV